MRTLRKALCLILCLSMVLSLGIFSVSAKDSYKDNVDDFEDVAKVGDAYEEAIDVMIGAGIIDGVSTTSKELDPQGFYTRAQAAKIITYMKIGPGPAEALPTPTSDPFDDVATTMWAAKYIQYCQSEGIIAGYGDGKFGPNDHLTGYQWATMLLRAVGYDENGETLTALQSLLANRITPSQTSALKEICDATYKICRFMGRPALNKQGKMILSRMLMPQYDKNTNEYARKTLEKMILLEKK